MKEWTSETASMWLASSGLPPERLRLLLETYKSPEIAAEAFQKNRESFCSLIQERERIVLQQNYDTINGWEQLLRQYGIHSVIITDPDYPERLKTIPDPPAVLFYQGNLSAIGSRSAAMVGSRRASYAGLQATERIAYELSMAGVGIVSGFAYGIDTAAHKGCLRGSSPTAAVLGCGLNMNYPAENADLRKEILDQGGVLISEYILYEKPLGAHFPVRNRIISGLSSIVILMEAKIRSGSMTTVNHAAEQGRDVYAYPGDPQSEMYSANHLLLREGALFFTKAKDILEDMKWLDKDRNVGQNIGCSRAAAGLTEDEKKILSALCPGILGFDQLVNQTGFDAANLLSKLTMMQIKGLVEALPGKTYQLKH